MAKKTFYTACVLCYQGCGAQVTVEDGKAVAVEGLKTHPLNKGKLCPKGEMMLEHLYHPDRLKYPLKKVDGRWVRVSWEQALSEIGAKLGDIKAEFGPSAIGFFCGSVGVESAEMVSLTHRFRAAIGSAQFFSVESICYRMRIRARQITFGKYLVEEMDSPLYVLWGHNPDASDYPQALAIRENLQKGSKVIVIDPRRIPLADEAEMYLAIRPGTDGALALALIHVIVNEKLYDAGFVAQWTYGFDRLVPHIQPYTPEWAESVTRVPADAIRALAHRLAAAKGVAIYHGTSTQDQSANGSQTDRAIAILQAITGNINVPGGWVMSPRIKLGNLNLLPPDDKPLGADEYPLFYVLWGRKSPYGVQNMVPESVPDKFKAFIVVGGNPLVTMPDSNALKEAYRNLDLLVVYEQFMTETAREAHYILPAANQLEYASLASNYNVCHCLPYLMVREKAVEPPGECKSILSFYTDLARVCGVGDLFPWKSDEDLVAFEAAPSGFDYETLTQRREGVYYTEKSYRIDEKTFATPSGKIEIYSQAFEDAGFDPLPTYLEPTKSPQGPRWNELGGKYPLVLSTGTRLLHFNNSQMHNIKALQAEEPHPRAELGPETAARYQVAHGDDVIIETDRGWVKMKAHVDERVMEGVVLVPHGFPGEANCNRLTDCQCREPVMGYPQFKGLLCSIRKAG